MDRKALVLGLLAVACGGHAPSFVTEHGVAVYVQGHDQFIHRSQADVMDSFLVDGLVGLHYSREVVLGCLRRAEVMVVDNSYRCVGRKRCAGEQWDNTLMVLDTGCAYTSAYIHELAHWLQQCAQGIYDPQHRDEELWRLVDSFPERCQSP